MALTAAELVAYLRLDKGDFESKLRGAESTMKGSSRNFRAWSADMARAVAGTITAGATGAAALATQVFKTGVNYNTLQQKSRAALTTIFDDGRKANDQMDALDDFAKNSPFAKDVFIRAQQQLLAFGMEAEDVVPTLDAVQDSVAATGGSSEDIAEITNVLAKVIGSGKITATTFDELGIRGIDAASIIGEQMGKTGEQIRDEVSSGSLDAGEAVSALVAGMKEDFGGAAANVKETAAGAADRVKAAWRDIGSVIAAPFVDPKGGGLAVDWMNEFADVLRAVENQAGPLTEVIVGRMTPAFADVSIVLKDAKDAIDSLTLEDLETGLDMVARHAPGIAAVSGALFALGTQNIPIIGGLTSALGPLPAALGAVALISPDMREALGDLAGTLKPLGDVLIDVAGIASDTFTVAVELTADALRLVSDLISPVVDAFGKLPKPIQDAVGVFGAFIALRKMFPKFDQSVTNMVGNVSSSIGGMSGGISGVMDSFRNWGGAFEGATGSLGDFKTAVGLTVGELGSSAKRGLRGAASGIVSFLGGPWGIALGVATTVIGLWAKEHQEAKARVQELSDSLDEQTGAITDSTESLVTKQAMEEDLSEALDMHDISLGQVTSSILDQGDAYDEVKEAIIESHLEQGRSQKAAEELMEKSRVIQYIEGQRDALNEEQEAIRQAQEALEDKYRRMDDGERSYDRYKESMRVVVDETINMSDRVAALNDALDELHGSAATQEERDRNLAETQRDLSSWFKENKEDISNMDEALIDMSTGMPSHTELGDQLNGMLSTMGEEAHDAAISIRDQGEAEGWSKEKIQEKITEAYKPYISTLQDLADQGVLSQDEVDALTTSILGVPEVTSYLITHGDSVTQTTKDVLTLTNEIESVPDGETYITDNATSQAVVDELKDLGYEVERLPDGKVKVVPQGIPAAEAAIQEWISKQRTIEVVPLVRTSGAGAPKKADGSKGRGRGVLRNYYGGIDTFKGMADGGVTEAAMSGNAVMDVAQMVKPGDIRFAGDRSDVDEAWIPLDGSSRSLSILREAIDRMPNFEMYGGVQGMKSGGVSGTSSSSSSRSSGGDSDDVENTWEESVDRIAEITSEAFEEAESSTEKSQKAMGEQIRKTGKDITGDTERSQKSMQANVQESQSAMDRDTRSSQDRMRSATAKSQELMDKDTASAQKRMQNETARSQSIMDKRTASAQKRMQNETARSQSIMDKDTASAQANMKSKTSSAQANMTSVTKAQTEDRRKASARGHQAMEADTKARLASMQSTTNIQFARMSATTKANMDSMRNATERATARMRSASRTEFSGMRSEGIQATSELRSGVVSEMGKTESPFTAKVNDLITVMRSFSTSLNKAYGDMGINVKRPTRVATGGVLGGYSPGSDIHTFSSPTGGELRLSGGEGILRPEATKVLGASWINSMNAAAQRGGTSAVKRAAKKTQSFASGGIFEDFGAEAGEIRDTHKANLPKNWVRPIGETVMDDVTKALQQELENLLSGEGWSRPTKGRVTSRYGAGRGAYPHAGMDIAKREGEPTYAPTPGVVRKVGNNIGPGRTGIGALVEHAAKMFTYYGHNPVGGLRVKVGDMLTQGDRIGAQGSTGNATGAHLHWEVHKNRAWADVNPHPYWDAAGGGSGGASGGGSDRWAAVVKAALSKNGLPTSAAYVNAWLRQIQTESGGNPKARQKINDINMRMGNPAVGLLQTIPPTFRAYAKPGFKNIMNPLHNAMAAIAYAKARYGSKGMLKVIGKGRGYQNGVNSAEPGWHAVGENGPEYVRFNGGESVRTNAQSRSLAAAQRISDEDARRIARELGKVIEPGDRIGTINTLDHEDLLRKMDERKRRRSKTRKAVGKA